jgi:hypothetical protein
VVPSTVAPSGIQATGSASVNLPVVTVGVGSAVPIGASQR